MSATDETARRERAERAKRFWAEKIKRPDADEQDNRVAHEVAAQMADGEGAFSVSVMNWAVILGYLAGAREEAAIKDTEIAWLREAVRHLHWVADKPTVYPMRFSEAVRRALEEKS